MERLARWLRLLDDEQKWWQRIAVIILLPAFETVYICSNRSTWRRKIRRSIKILPERLACGFQHFSGRLKFRFLYPAAWRQIRLRAMDYADDMIDEHEHVMAMGRAKYERHALNCAVALKPPVAETEATAEPPDACPDVVQLRVNSEHGYTGEFFMRRAYVESFLEAVHRVRAAEADSLMWAEIRGMEPVRSEFGLSYFPAPEWETVYEAPREIADD